MIRIWIGGQKVVDIIILQGIDERLYQLLIKRIPSKVFRGIPFGNMFLLRFLIVCVPCILAQFADFIRVITSILTFVTEVTNNKSFSSKCWN